MASVALLPAFKLARLVEIAHQDIRRKRLLLEADWSGSRKGWAFWHRSAPYGISWALSGQPVISPFRAETTAAEPLHPLPRPLAWVQEFLCQLILKEPLSQFLVPALYDTLVPVRSRLLPLSAVDILPGSGPFLDRSPPASQGNCSARYNYGLAASNLALVWEALRPLNGCQSPFHGKAEPCLKAVRAPHYQLFRRLVGLCPACN